jgi:hypothetical protein
MAAPNAGEDEAMNSKAPPAEKVGSGKFGTRCERMQSANLGPATEPLDALLLALSGLLEALLQAASTSTPATRRTAIGTR